MSNYNPEHYTVVTDADYLPVPERKSIEICDRNYAKIRIMAKQVDKLNGMYFTAALKSNNWEMAKRITSIIKRKRIHIAICIECALIGVA